MAFLRISIVVSHLAAHSVLYAKCHAKGILILERLVYLNDCCSL